MDNELNLLLDKTKDFNLSLDNKQLDLFKRYQHFLEEYNRHTNIVSDAGKEVVIIKHFTDSLSLGLLMNKMLPRPNFTIIDVGAGGGFPSVPILIAYPESKLCAVDSVGKKTKFLELLSNELGLESRMEIVNSRAEDLYRSKDSSAVLDHKPYAEGFDLVVSRAVASLNVLSEYCLPFARVGGYFVAYKGKNADHEIMESKKALSVLGGKIIDIASYKLEDAERKLILIEKIKHTPEKYPRKQGVPEKKPII